MTILASALDRLPAIQPMRLTGAVANLRGLTLLVDDLPAPIGTFVMVHPSAPNEPPRPGEIVGFDGAQSIVMLLGQTTGVRAGDRVVAEQVAQTVLVGERLLGRVVNALGAPIDGLGPIPEATPRPLHPLPISPMQRTRIHEAIPTGVRAIDLMATVGKGQRVGVFAGPGVGKSTLLGSIARNTAADIAVVALVGERGREVRDFLETALGDEGRKRSVVVTATSDESPLMRIRAVQVACAAAEHFRDEGADVMLLMDSVTRYAQALRQVGLAVGEPPATKGYTPSVFASLPLLLERAGAVDGAGSITGFYTILVEGDDMTEPIADAARGVLDGHIILSRDLAQRGHYPAIDVLDSVSRVADDVATREHIAARRLLVRLLAAQRDVQDLLEIGAYARGSNPTADVAIELKPRIDELLQQTPTERDDYESAQGSLIALATEAGQMLASAGQSQPQRQPQG